MFSFQQELRNFYKLLSELTGKVNKLEKDFTCSQCNSVEKCLDISNQGDEDKFLNQKGDFIVISPSLDCEDVKDCIGITPTGEANKFLNEQGDYVTVSGSGFTCSDLLTCSTTNLPEGSRLYYTDARVLSYVSTLPVSTFSNDAGYITNSALAPYLTSATAAATYYPLTNPSSYIALTALSAGTGINYNNGTGVITNSAPDVTVVLNNGTGINVTGSYPNFTITNTSPNLPDYIQSILDSNTVDLDVTTNVLTANVRHQDTTTINLSDNASGLKADLATGAAVANLGFTPEDVANKATDFTTVNNTLYPTVEAVKNYVDKEKVLDLWLGNSTTTATAETILHTITITANDVADGDIVWITEQISSSQTSGTLTTRVRVGTSAIPANITLETQLLNSSANAAAGGLYHPMNNFVSFSGGNITAVLRAVLTGVAGVQLFDVASPPLTATWYIYITVQKSIVGGTVSLRSSIVKRERL